MIEGHR